MEQGRRYSASKGGGGGGVYTNFDHLGSGFLHRRSIIEPIRSVGIEFRVDWAGIHPERVRWSDGQVDVGSGKAGQISEFGEPNVLWKLLVHTLDNMETHLLT